MPVQHDLAILIPDAEGPWGGRAGRSRSKIGVVYNRLRFPPLERVAVYPAPAVPQQYAEEGASLSINPLQATARQGRRLALEG